MTETKTQALLSRRSLSFAFVALVVIALVGVLLYGFVNKGTQAGSMLDGKPAPDFTLNLFDGRSITLSDLKGKPVLINFWASWCGPCRDEAPVLERGWRAYKDKGVIFIGVDVRDEEKAALAFIKEFNITYPNGPDTTNRISINYGVTGVPESFFVNRDGVVIRRHVGATNEQQLKRYIEEILQ